MDLSRLARKGIFLFWIVITGNIWSISWLTLPSLQCTRMANQFMKKTLSLPNSNLAMNSTKEYRASLSQSFLYNLCVASCTHYWWQVSVEVGGFWLEFSRHCRSVFWWRLGVASPWPRCLEVVEVQPQCWISTDLTPISSLYGIIVRQDTHTTTHSNHHHHPLYR